jgi:DNA-binding NarL/FixJ family response regulator
MMQGKSNEETCRELGLSDPTVKNLVAAILKALKKFGRGRSDGTASAVLAALHECAFGPSATSLGEPGMPAFGG